MNKRRKTSQVREMRGALMDQIMESTTYAASTAIDCQIPCLPSSFLGTGGITRTQAKDRLAASFPRRFLEHNAIYTAAKYQEWYEQGLIKERHSAKTLMTMYKEIAETRAIKDLATRPILLWDPDLPETPELDRGQHRREALMKQKFPMQADSLTPASYMGLHLIRNMILSLSKLSKYGPAKRFPEIPEMICGEMPALGYFYLLIYHDEIQETLRVAVSLSHSSNDPWWCVGP
ncbi:hypothetical protein PV10_04775 [Exophiala mesophila]|uniref:Uncharacterized protein n=1 Tax=Exophiala mesophila TaxID=212818 RepID=A0A0D1ZI69_EXOME|nr:uncharacterized protein PV10_04775 [Exophiala mesophila]KIV93569.1 hypothetical protein PV10_04775 [Exophiala mesophila]